MIIKLRQLIAVQSALVLALPSAIQGANWFTSTGEVKEEAYPFQEAIKQGGTTVGTFSATELDLSISLYNSPAGDNDGNTQDIDKGSADQDKIEKIIQYAADAIYEATEGAHKIGQVRIFTNKKRRDLVDIIWGHRGIPQVYDINGIDYTGEHVFMFDIFPNGWTLKDKKTKVDWDYLDDLMGGGFVLAHELSHYLYGLYDEYQIDPTDIAVRPSMMNQATWARDRDTQTLTDARWLQFSIKAKGVPAGLYENTNQTAQHRVYGESCWETLSRDAIIDRLTPSLNGFPPRMYWRDLVAVAPKGGDLPLVPSLTSISPEARSKLDIIWMADATIAEIVIDSSGSMEGKKIANARTAAKVLVDQSKIGSYVGVLEFNDFATEVFPLTKIANQATKNKIKAAINKIQAGGGTAIGEAAQFALDSLTAFVAPHGNTGYNKVVYFLSDGENTASHIDPLASIPEYKKKKIPIFAFSYGSDADTVTLRKMASLTKGELYISKESLAEIVQAFQDASAAASGTSIVGSGSKMLKAGSSQIEPFTVDSSIDSMIVTVAFYGRQEDLTVVLIDPSTTGSPISHSTAYTTPKESGDSRPESVLLFSVTNPTQGEWQIKATETAGKDTDFSWKVHVIEDGSGYDLTGGLFYASRYFDSHDITYPDPFILHAAIVRDLKITDADVVATITAPDGNIITSYLQDDGLGYDYVAGDGIYTGSLWYDLSGVYEISIRAKGRAGVAKQGSLVSKTSADSDGNFVPLPPPSPITEDFERFIHFQVQTVNVVPDDHGNTHETATLLSAMNDQVLSGRIETAGDVDVFKIVPTGLTELFIRVSDLAFGMDPVLKITNKLHVIVAEGTLDTSSSKFGLLSMRIPVTGTETYFAQVSHTAVNGTGFFRISAGSAMSRYDDPAVTPRPTNVVTPRPTQTKSGKNSKKHSKKLNTQKRGESQND